MMLGFTTATMNIVPGQGTQVDISGLTTVFITSVIFHSYLIGIVAGKISEESVSAGFKHAALLVILAAIAAKLVPMFLTPDWGMA